MSTSAGGTSGGQCGSGPQSGTSPPAPAVRYRERGGRRRILRYGRPKKRRLSPAVNAVRCPNSGSDALELPSRRGRYAASPLDALECRPPLV